MISLDDPHENVPARQNDGIPIGLQKTKDNGIPVVLQRSGGLSEEGPGLGG